MSKILTRKQVRIGEKEGVAHCIVELDDKNKIIIMLNFNDAFTIRKTFTIFGISLPIGEMYYFSKNGKDQYRDFLCDDNFLRLEDVITGRKQDKIFIWDAAIKLVAGCKNLSDLKNMLQDKIGKIG